MSLLRVSFTVHAVPVAQPRQRHTRSGHNYTPKDHPVNVFKAACSMAFCEAYTGEPANGPIRLEATYVLPRPKAMRWKTKDMPRAWHTKKPDEDNLSKALRDALTMLAWHDDSQICISFASKYIASGDEQPHVDVAIYELEAD